MQETVPGMHAARVDRHFSTDEIRGIVGTIRNLFNASVLEPSIFDPVRRTVAIPKDLPMAPRAFQLQANYAL